MLDVHFDNTEYIFVDIFIVLSAEHKNQRDCTVLSCKCWVKGLWNKYFSK